MQVRLTVVYAAGIFAIGIAALAAVALPLADLGSTVPAGSSGPGTITGGGQGIGPHQLLAGSAVAVAVLLPVALAAGWLVAGHFLRPLRHITATATAISAGNLHQRLDLGEPVDELTELGRLLDDLLTRLEASFDAQRHFVANASHELRTPLAGQRTLLEVTLADPDAGTDTLRAACQEALALGGQQERLLQGLFALATSERGTTRHDTVDLDQVVRTVLASRHDPATRSGIELDDQLAPAVTAGDPRLIESLVANLVDNAIRHNRPGGHVQVATLTAGAQSILTVTNSGPVVPGDQIERLFQPFQRLASDRHSRGEGHGLGLAIVDAVARAHHATRTVEAPPEGGLTVTVRFAAHR